MIYFIQVGDDGPVKIGFTKLSPSIRLSGLQVANPYPLRMLGRMVGNAATERFLHKKFARNRLRGEWFSPTTSLLQYCEDRAESTRYITGAILTEIDVPPALKRECIKRAKATFPPMGWTQQLVVLAQRGLAMEIVPRTAKPSD